MIGAANKAKLLHLYIIVGEAKMDAWVIEAPGKNIVNYIYFTNYSLLLIIVGYI